MSYVGHPGVYLPGDENARIFRYVDLPKFVAMLQSRTLYFAQLAHLDDRFEGRHPEATLADLRANLQRIRESQGDADWLTEDALRAHLETARANTFVNSWCASDHELPALWQIYTDNRGIALQSTIKRLRDAIDLPSEPFYVSEVRYIDFATDSVDTSSLFHQVLTKRRSFEYESEIRAFVCDWAAWDRVSKTHEYQPNNNIGRGLPVRLDTLIERVCLAPGAPAWQAAPVRWLLDEAHLPHVPVQASSLDESPPS